MSDKRQVAFARIFGFLQHQNSIKGPVIAVQTVYYVQIKTEAMSL